MVLQFTAFVGMPAIFYFPAWQLLYIFLAGMLCGVLSAVGPT